MRVSRNISAGRAIPRDRTIACYSGTFYSTFRARPWHSPANTRPAPLSSATVRSVSTTCSAMGQAVQYGSRSDAKARPGSGTSTVSNKREWPSWTPTPSILARQPNLPRHMEGGPQNPMGARALYLGDTLYRIHGTNEPWMIGEEVSSGCIRMTNEDVIDLYNRTRMGAKVIVIR